MRYNKNSLVFKKLREIYRNNPEKIFASKTFSNSLTSLAKMVSDRFDLSFPIRVILSENRDEGIAYTDNRKIVIVKNNELVEKAKTFEEKYLTILGSLGHECGHVLFTNFDIFQEVKNSLLNKEYYVNPCFDDAHLYNDFSKFSDYIFDDNFKGMEAVVSLFHQILNVVEDKYVNNRIIEKFPGSFKSGITRIYDLMFEDVDKAKSSDYEIVDFLNEIHYFLETNETTPRSVSFKEFSNPEFIKFLNGIVDLNKMEERIQACYNILAYGIDYIFDFLNQIKSQQDLNDLIKDLTNQSQGQTQIGSGQAILNESTDNQEKNNSQQNSNNVQDKQEGKDDKSSYNKGLSSDDLLNGAVREMLSHNEDEALAEVAHERIRDVNGFNGNIRSDVCFPVGNKQNYSLLSTTLKPYINRLVKGFTELIDDRATGLTTRNLLSGRRINPAASASSQGKVFIKKTLPGEVSEVAVGILVDQSGSMCGTRIEIAKRTAIMLAEFCERLSIPYSVMGHYHTYDTVILDSYVDYESSKNKKFNISKMHASGCNRDGFALKYATKSLSERPEPVKLFFLISDGWPSAYSSDEEAAKDILEGVKFCKKNDIILSSMAIGEDKQQIKNLYGDCFVDISDLSKLPKKIIDKIKKFL